MESAVELPAPSVDINGGDGRRVDAWAPPGALWAGLSLLSGRRGVLSGGSAPDARGLSIPARSILAPAVVLRLQRLAGNQAVTALLRDSVGVGDARGRLLPPAPGGAASHDEVAQREQQRDPDGLYLATRKASGGQTGDDRIRGRHLNNWAIASGGARIRSDATLRRLQEQPEGTAGILVDIYQLLIDRLWGSARDPDTGEILPDEFEGSMNARGEAVFELGGAWGPIEHWLTQYLRRIYEDQLAGAISRTPNGAELVTQPEEIERIRLRPHGHTTEGDRWNDVIRVGQRRGYMHFVDIWKSEVAGSNDRQRRKATNRGLVWFYVDRHPLWYYKRSSDLREVEAFVSEVARQTSESTKFAAELFPLLIKGFALSTGFAGGFAPSLATRIGMEIASAAVEELGEEGLRSARGEKGRSGWEILKSAGLNLLVNRIMDMAFHASSIPDGPGGGAISAAFEQKAAGAVRREVVATEKAEVVAALGQNGPRKVTDDAMKAEGYTVEVEVISHGQLHIYRRNASGRWCRFSETPMCELDLGADVEAFLKAKEKAPRPGETPEQWAERTNPYWDDLPGPARRAAVDAAETAMQVAELELAIFDRNTLWSHYLTQGGYEEVLRTQQLRSGGGNANLGQGENVRVRKADMYEKATSTHFDFKVPEAPINPRVHRDRTGVPFVAWPIPSGDMLPIVIKRIRYANGAVATRTSFSGRSAWNLRDAEGTWMMVSTDELAKLGEMPILPSRGGDPSK